MKKSICFILLCLAIIIIISIHTTENKILYGRFYNIEQSLLKENISFEIVPQEYTKKDYEYEKEENIYKYKDSQILIDKIIANDEYVNVFIKISTNWNMFKGTSLNVKSVNRNNGIETSFAKIKYKVLDESKNSIDIESGLQSSGVILLRFNKNNFYNNKKLLVNLNGFLKTDYKLKFIN